MKVPFLEELELEQRVALIAAVTRRMAEMEMLTDEAKATDSLVLSRRIIGVSDMDAIERRAVLTAVASVASRVAEAIAVVTSECVAPTVASFAENAGRTAERLRPNVQRRYVTTGASVLPELLVTREEVKS